MSYQFLNMLSVNDLRKICKEVGIDNPENICKGDLISYLKNGFKKYGLPEPKLEKEVKEKKEEKGERYTIIEKIGHEGKEGTIYSVKYGKKVLAMKQFKKTKSENNIIKEGELLKIASKLGVSPKVYDIDLENKRIVMEKLDKSLFDILKENRGKLESKYQKRMIEICEKLDKAGIYHGDPSPLNFMTKGDELYIIDFGFGSKIDEKFIEKNRTSKPNISFMILGFLIKVKDVCNVSEYKELMKVLSKEDKKKFGLNT